MNRATIRRAVAVPAALTVAVLTMGAGCGSDGAQGPNQPGTTHVAVQGGPSDKHCKIVLETTHPEDKQLTATLSVDCDFPVDTAVTTLVIQGRPIGADGTSWDNVDDPVTSESQPPVSLTFTHNCVVGIEYQAAASIDAVAYDGTPVHAVEDTTPRYYDASECSSS